MFLTHKDVTVYYVYRNNDVDQGVRDYWFDNKADSDDGEGFDVRDLVAKLPSYKSGETPISETQDWRKDVIRLAIDAGLIEAGD